MSDRYRIEHTGRRVEKEIERLPRSDRDRVISAIQELAATPRPYGSKQLEPGIYRLRVGNYRVIYRVLDDEHLVLIGHVARRSERTYRKWRQLFEEPEQYNAEPQPAAATTPDRSAP